MTTATVKKQKPGIRYDLFAVKVRCGDNGVNEPVVERIFRSRESARNYKRNRQPSLGYSIDKKIVHPAQWVVNGYTACGNQIED